MLIKTLINVATTKERKLLSNVRWGRVCQNGSPQLAQHGVITAIWHMGCALTTRHNLREGETVWIRARDELGQIVLSLVGTVTWNENAFSLDGYRCEVRFRGTLEAASP